VPATWWLLYRTRFGGGLRAVGENPAAVDTAGVFVVGLRYAAVVDLRRALRRCGRVSLAQRFRPLYQGHVAGRGYIALAAG